MHPVLRDLRASLRNETKSRLAAEARAEKALKKAERAEQDRDEMRKDLTTIRSALARLEKIVEAISATQAVPQSPYVDQSAGPRAGPSDGDLLYGVPAIARAIKLTPPQVYHLKGKHGFPVFKVGGRVCARKSELAAWIANHGRG